VSDRHRVVIVGGGFGGLQVAKRLRKADVDVTLIDRRNFHLFQPLLYQVATGGLSPGDVTTALRWVLRRQRNVRVWLGEVTAVDVDGRTVTVDGVQVPFDSLVLATGSETSYFGHDGWMNSAPGLKSIEDATHIRSRVLAAFEAAERESDAGARRRFLTFVIIGAGPTGVELAGAVAELARDTLRGDFRAIDPASARIILVDAAARVLPTYPADLSAKCAASLKRLGVELRTGTKVLDIADDAVEIEKSEGAERLPCHTVLWAAGVRASSMGRMVADAAGASLDRGGRVVVNPDLTVPGHGDVFVIGDLARVADDSGTQLPGTAPVAMSEGRYVARAIRRRLEGRDVEPFRYVDKGQLATIGRAAAVADFGKVRFSGYPAWLLWLFVHLAFLIEFENRVLVMIQWAWNYFTRNRGARLITRSGADPPR
jgi:NADH:quinone reductase (non-electrogenic)